MTDRTQIGIRRSGTETCDIEISEANIERLCDALSISARVVLEGSGPDGYHAALQALQLRKDLKRQRRENEYDS